MLTFRKIIENLNLKIPVKYYNSDDSRLKSSEYLLYLKVVSDKEQKEYETLDIEEKKNFKTTTSQIYVPRMSIYKYENVADSNKGVSFELSYTIDHVRKLTHIENEKQKELLAACLYMILHEVGHFEDLKAKEFNVWEYTKENRDEKEKIFKERENIQQKIFLESDKEKQKKLAYTYFDTYNKISDEKRANDYADKHFENLYNNLLKALKESCLL